MSNWFLCDQCDNKIEDVSFWDVFCKEHCDGKTTRKKAIMYDYGHERGHMHPYDEPLDVCPLFKRREDR